MAAPKISSSMQKKIEKLIHKWEGKLTWELLTKRVELELGLNTTRQTLCTYTGIDTAFKNKKSVLRGATPALYKKMTASEVDLLKRIEAKEQEIKLLNHKNNEQLRMIERMLANASELPNINLYDLVKRRPEEDR